MARIDVSQLEPAERNPAQLRRTGWTIALVMIFGGIVVTWAYKLVYKRQLESGRPPIVAKLKDNFGAVNQDRKGFKMSHLEGRISLITLVALNEQETTAESLRAMKLVAERLNDREDLRFLCITIDPERDSLELLKAWSEELGVAGDSRWSFVAASEDPTRSYVKDQLRLGSVLEREEEGKPRLEFVSMVALVDQRLHLRGRYDFNEALAVQEDAKRMLVEEPERAEELKAKDHLEDVKALEDHLLAAIDFISNEKLEK